MTHFTISDADQDRITAAVRAAEARSDGEIVTVLAPRSDAYHDVALHYAIVAMLVPLVLVATDPIAASDWVTRALGGWDHAVPLGLQISLLLGLQILCFLVVRYALAWMPLRMLLTPRATKARRVRRQAITLFRACAESRTARKTAILLYLSLAEHRAEIVADSTISSRVPPERWGDAMAALVEAVHDGRAGDGLVAAVEHIGAILREQVPAGHSNPNELPDRLIQL